MKVGIVGMGWVGSSVAISLLHTGVAAELLLNDCTARGATADQANDFASRAADVGIAMQTLSYFGMRSTAPVGFVLGYGAIATPDIEEGLRRLRRVL